ncbi:MAG: hypothetical protein HQL29_06500 [Candidatus Omnitrophica bacterium]|nr:hypothetical protein [Candidatus Omnitrophota bacterium]
MSFLLFEQNVSAEFVYQSAGKRDPFVPLLGDAATRTVSGIKGIIGKEDLTLQGVLVAADGSKQAIVNGEIISEGDSVGNVLIVAISDNTVRVRFKESEFDLVLYE